MSVSVVSAVVHLLLLLLLTRGSDQMLFKDKRTANCAGTMYDHEDHICCEGRLHRRADFTGRLSCCYDRVYDVDRYVCCGRNHIPTKAWVLEQGECYGGQVRTSASIHSKNSG
ncbi:hypothetical protein NP493_1037g00023 [Ridgeia piscesae]|uniref:Galaxin-like repeats domain-containing protein n=1 Tax=Ridgeia piscesae TaxID=27915 RepID=A0AAD9KHE0_RIDPI|nr:hypothetical protein NP493_1037g00023 [Ridgeia piscesae]